jgi:hypothetical protein
MSTKKRILYDALPLAAAMLALHGYWYGVADRYAVFLYEHYDATPLDATTRGRYFMAGFVAAGLCLLPYLLALWLRGQIARRRQIRYMPSPWQQIWLCSGPIVLISVTLIAMYAGRPHLPLIAALPNGISAAIGMGLLLWAGQLAATQPLEMIWLGLEGLGAMLPLSTVPVLGLMDEGLASPLTQSPYAPVIAVSGPMMGLIWLWIVGQIRRCRTRSLPSAKQLAGMGLLLHYLGFPLLHYLFATPPAYKYITDMANFFAKGIGLQTLTWFVFGSLVWWAGRGRR